MAARVRRVDQGDFEEDDPMAAIIDRFRKDANLIESAPDRSLLRFAHEIGWDRTGASDVREAWAERSDKTPPDRPEIAQMELIESQGASVPPRASDRLSGDSTEPEQSPDESDESPETCAHAITIEIGPNELACEDCGEVLFEAGPSYDDCDHEWEQRVMLPRIAIEFAGDIVRSCDFCLKCNSQRHDCEGGAHHSLVELADMVYCGTCGHVLSTIWADRISPGFRKEQTIHHPAFTDTEELRVEDTTDDGDFEGLDVMTAEEILETIDKEILY